MGNLNRTTTGQESVAEPHKSKRELIGSHSHCERDELDVSSIMSP